MKVCITLLIIVLEISSSNSYLAIFTAHNMQLSNLTFKNFSYSDMVKKDAFILRFEKLVLQS